MTRLNQWTSPLHIEQVAMGRGSAPNTASITLRVTPRRWHPAWWWMAIRLAPPRDLVWPGVWVAIVRAILTAGKA